MTIYRYVTPVIVKMVEFREQTTYVSRAGATITEPIGWYIGFDDDPYTAHYIGSEKPPYEAGVRARHIIEVEGPDLPEPEAQPQPDKPSPTKPLSVVYRDPDLVVMHKKPEMV